MKLGETTIMIMPFGKHKGQSVEQIALKYYDYFAWIIDNEVVKKPELRDRYITIENIVNNFVSVRSCARCDNPAMLVQVYRNPFLRQISIHGIYCSQGCFDKDPNKPYDPNDYKKTTLEPLKFRSALSDRSSDTHKITKVMAICMGVKPHCTQEQLAEFFDNVRCWPPDTNYYPRMSNQPMI